MGNLYFNGNGNTGGNNPNNHGQWLYGNFNIGGNTGNYVKTGYTWIGWNIIQSQATAGVVQFTGEEYTYDYPEIFDNEGYGPDVTLYAVWKQNGFSVTYNGNGSTGGAAPTDSTVYPTGTSVTVLGRNTLTRTGYNFKGWNSNQTNANAGTVQYTAGQTFNMGSANVTLYAVWKQAYTITYNGNGNTGGTAPSDGNSPYDTGSTVTVLGAGTLTRTNYVFKGWNSNQTNANNGMVQYAQNATFTISANTTLYAVWAATYTITYNGNSQTSGTVPSNNTRYEQGASVPVTHNSGNLTRTYYVFKGWTVASSAPAINATPQHVVSGTTVTPNTFTMPANNVTLYAVWGDVTYSVTYNGNGSTGGSVPTNSNQYANGASVPVVANTGNLTRTGHRFMGWTRGTSAPAVNSTPQHVVSGTTVTPNTFTMSTANVTIYAVWRQTFTVTYNGNGNTSGTAPSDSNSPYTTGSTVTVLGQNNLARTNYVFKGWNTNQTNANNGTVQYTQGQTFTITANTTLYAVWAPTYSITYNGNSNTGGSVPTNSTRYEQGVNAPVTHNTGNLVRTNHTFKGWTIASSAPAVNATPQHVVSGTTVTPSTFTMPANNVTIYAVWEENPRYGITYNANNATSGSVPTNSTTYYTGQSVPVAANTGNLVRTNYNFKGWANSAGATSVVYAVSGSTVTPSTFSMGSANVILYAFWRQTYTLTYNANRPAGFSGTGSVPTNSNRYEQGESAPVVANTGNLTTEGHTFLGWATASNATTPIYTVTGSSVSPSTMSMPASNTVLYAVWKKDNYSVTYNANNATGGTVPTDSAVYGLNDAVTVKANTGNLIRTGYTFRGWDTNQNATTPAHVVSGSTVTPPTFSMPANAVVLYAVWTAIYTVTYNGNGSTGGTAPTDPNSPYLSDSVVTVLTVGSLIRDNYTFIGWNTSQANANAGTVQYTAGQTFTISVNTTLYAVWQENAKYTVTYYGNTNTSGSPPVDSNSPYYTGTSVTVLGQGSLVKAGWNFLGWNTNQNASAAQYTAGSTFTISGNVDLYAIWSQIPQYTVTYNGNGADFGVAPVDANSPYLANSTVTVMDENTLEKANHTFLGWAINAAAESPDILPNQTFNIIENVLFYAVWSENPKYSVTYNDNDADFGSVPVDNNMYYAGQSVFVEGNTGNLQRDGFTFKGWAFDNDAATPDFDVADFGEWEPFVIQAGNVVLYAVWEAIIIPDTWTVTYAPNWPNNTTGLGSVPVDNNSYQYDQTVTVQANTGNLTRNGYTFLGWSHSSVADTPSFQVTDEGIVNPSTFNMPNSNVTLYAVWLEDEEPVEPDPTFTLTYNGNDATSGNVPTDNNEYVFGATVTVKANLGGLQKTGYVFLGWSFQGNENTTLDFKLLPNGTLEPATFSMPEANVVLVAVWELLPQYIVAYLGNGHTGGSVPVDNNSPYFKGSTVVVLGQGSLTREGYTFQGWATTNNAATAQYVAGSTFTIVSDVYLFVVWRLIPTFTVTYQSNRPSGSVGSGSRPVDNNTYVQNAIVQVQANPGEMQTVGYYFRGWAYSPFASTPDFTVFNYSSVSPTTFVMPAANVVLYAVWQKIPIYTVVYDGNGHTSGSVPVDHGSPHFENSIVVVMNPVGLVRHGFIFAGWAQTNIAPAATHQPGNLFTINANVIFYAVWTPAPRYMVTYMPNQASSGLTPIDPNQYLAGDTVTVQANPGGLARTGFKLLGWSANSADKVPGFALFNTTVVPATFSMPYVNVVLYAVWEAVVMYSVSYHPDGATSGEVPENKNQFMPNSIVSVRSNIKNLYREGYTFIGWSYLPNQSVANFTVVGADVYPSSFTITSNVELHAVWQIRATYKVTYYPNWPQSQIGTGNVPQDNTIYYYSDVVTIRGNTGNLSVPDYTLLGWMWNSQLYSLKQDGTVQPNSVVVQGNVDFFAVWLKNEEIIPEECPHYGDIDKVRDICRAMLPIGSEITDELLDRFRCIAADWIHSEMLKAQQYPPFQIEVHAQINHLADLYAAGRYLQLRSPTEDRHDYLKQAIEGMKNLLKTKYGVDPDLKPKDIPTTPIIAVGIFSINW